MFGRRNLLVAGALFLTALFSLWALQLAFRIHPLGVSDSPYWVYQAESLLHGRWDLDLPASLADIVVLGGKHYIIYPPFPALLFLPFVALFGLHTSDILLTALLSAANLSLLFLLFEQARASGFSRPPGSRTSASRCCCTTARSTCGSRWVARSGSPRRSSA